MQTVEQVFEQTQLLNWMAVQQGIHILPGKGLVLDDELWEVGVEATQKGFQFYVGSWEANDAAGVLKVMKEQAG
jgi:hypothetical protein